MKFKLHMLCAAMVFVAASVQAAPTLHSVAVRSDAYQNKDAINNIVSKYIGHEINIKLLRKILNEVNSYFHDLGYLSAQAFYPDQSSQDGSLIIEIAQPKLNHVNFNNLANLNSYAMSVLFSDLKNYQNKYFSEKELESKLYKLNDLGLFKINGAYENSNQSDSVNLNLTLDPVKKVNFAVFADNHGTKAAGKFRGGAQMNINNLTGSADALSLFVARSQESQDNFNLSYEIPVSSHPTILGTSLCLSDYELADEYKILGAQGKSLTYDIYVKEPLLRSNNYKLNFTGGFRYKKLSDEFKTFDVEFKKHSNTLYSGLNGVYVDKKLALEGNLNFNFGSLKNDDEYEMYEDGSFNVATFDGLLSYSFNSYVAFENRVYIQKGSDNLESSERFSPAGAFMLSAYDSNVISADSGILNSSALSLKPFVNLDFKISPHFDLAYAKSADDSGEKIYGTGIRFNFKKGGFFIDSSIDAPIGHKISDDTDSLKIFVRTGYHYA